MRHGGAGCGAGEEALDGARSGDRYRDWTFDGLARFRTGQSPIVGIDDCLAAVRIVDAAYRKAAV